MDKQLEVIRKCIDNLVGQNVCACNFFVRDVATALGVNENNFLNNTANSQISQLAANSNWTNLGQGNVGASAAVAAANAGKFVIAGWRNPSGHGHVAIAVAGTPHLGWPKGYWGHFPNGPGGFNESLRNTFGADKRPVTQFFSREF